jgi:hypothetical protein
MILCQLRYSLSSNARDAPRDVFLPAGSADDGFQSHLADSLNWRIVIGRVFIEIPMSGSESSHPCRILAAPEPSRPELRNTVLNVDCADDEDVQWQWTETAQGRFVSGYRIVPCEATEKK